MYYLVTIRKHQVKDYVSDEDLLEVQNTLPGIIRDSCNERHGKYKQMHTHLIVECKKNFTYKGHTKYKGFRIHWLPIQQSLYRVADYIHKHCENHSPYRILQNSLANYFNNHYCF